ncbi:Hypothetical predicted protein [Lecanosticta acicola]|uniref:Secreted protein CSS2 C-terminal domain-containing protein n=1 Tax=Lecanosticta acicola TaxID=111012 RepID=A0AAI9EAM9_9PEZI|nr:Hypothetical predicted protein [Lecanosticta acicola]
MVRPLWALGLAAAMVEAQLNRTISFDTSYQPIDDTGFTLAVVPGVLHESSPLLQPTKLVRRKKIEVVVAVAVVATAGFNAIISANSGFDLYNSIAAKISKKSDNNACTLTYGTDADDGYYVGYAYRATTTGTNCDTTAIEKTVQNAVYECANKLHSAGVITGCCQFSHGGTWTGHLRLTNAPDRFPATYVNC